MVAGLAVEELLEAMGGTVSAGIDGYVAWTTNTTDDDWASPVKSLVGTAAKVVSKYAGGKGLRHASIAFKGHNYGQWIGSSILKKMMSPTKP